MLNRPSPPPLLRGVANWKRSILSTKKRQKLYFSVYKSKNLCQMPLFFDGKGGWGEVEQTSCWPRETDGEIILLWRLVVGREPILSAKINKILIFQRINWKSTPHPGFFSYNVIFDHQVIILFILILCVCFFDVFWPVFYVFWVILVFLGHVDIPLLIRRLFSNFG